MKPHVNRGTGFSVTPLLHFGPQTPAIRRRCVSLSSAEISLNNLARRVLRHEHRHVSVSVRCRQVSEGNGEFSAPRRRDVLVAPFLGFGACVLRSAVARADEKPPDVTSSAPTPATATESPAQEAEVKSPVVEEKEEVINSRIYDATVIGEPLAVGKDKRKVWEKVMNARIVYLGEAEQVPVRDDKELELEIVKNLRKRCAEAERPISLALEAFPSNLQDQLNQYMDKKYSNFFSSICFLIDKNCSSIIN